MIVARLDSGFPPCSQTAASLVIEWAVCYPELEDNPVIRILILNESKDHAYSALVSQLSALEDVVIAEAEDTLDLQSHLKIHTIHLLLLIVKRAPSELFLQAISKSRNLTGFRDTYFISIHKEFLQFGIQKSLMAGAKTIYLEPVDPSKVLQEIKAILAGNLSYFPALPPFYKITPTPCRIEVFGRIGKIFMDPAGDLQVETDAKLSPGQSLAIRSLMAHDQSCSHFTYSVLSAANEDVYYRYHHSYHLSWQATSEMKEALTKWANANQKAFALPKTKVLWIRETALGNLEKALNKTLFSVHLESPGRLTHAYLCQLNPLILISENLPEISLQSIQSWIVEKQLNPILISTASKPPAGWHSLLDDGVEPFEKAFIQLVKPILSERVSTSLREAKYLDRKSDYSRFSLSMSGRLVSLESSHVILELENELEPNTIFYLNCPAFQGRGEIKLYLKVKRAEPLPRNSGFQLICELLPISDRPDLFFATWSKWVQAQAQTTGIETAPSNPVPADRTELFFLQPRFIGIGLDTLKVIIGLCVAALLSLLIYLVFPKTEIHGVTPANMQSAFRAIREVFK